MQPGLSQLRPEMMTAGLAGSNSGTGPSRGVASVRAVSQLHPKVDPMHFPRLEEDASFAQQGEAPSTTRLGLINLNTALRILCLETGGEISRSTLYRWVGSGKVLSIRVGRKILIPLHSLNEVIRQCNQGERV